MSLSATLLLSPRFTLNQMAESAGRKTRINMGCSWVLFWLGQDVGKGSWYVVPCGRGRFRYVDVAAVAGAGDLTPDAKGAKITAATKSSVTTLPPENES